MFLNILPLQWDLTHCLIQNTNSDTHRKNGRIYKEKSSEKHIKSNFVCYLFYFFITEFCVSLFNPNLCAHEDLNFPLLWGLKWYQYYITYLEPRYYPFDINLPYFSPTSKTGAHGRRSGRVSWPGQVRRSCHPVLISSTLYGEAFPISIR